MTRHSARLALLLTAAVAIAFFTLRPGSPSAAWSPGPCCLLTDFVLNILLFVPYGVALGLLGRRPIAAAGIGAITSAAIEIAQLWIPGRESSIHDVMTNCAGALLGALIVAGWAARARWWRTVGPLVSTLVVLASIAGSFLVRPATPAPRTWWGQWAHDFSGTVLFPGRVLGFTLQGIPIPDGPLAESTRLNTRLANADTISWSATVVSGREVAGRAQLVGLVADRPGGEYLSLWQEGRSLLAFARLRLTDASLHNAWLRLDSALPGAAGDTVALSATMTRRRLILAAAHSGTREEGTLDLSATLFWGSFLPFELETGSRVPLWPILPMGLAFVGLGMGSRNWIALVIATAVALFGGPLLAGTALPPWAALAAGTIGAWGGRIISRWLGLLEASPRP